MALKALAGEEDAAHPRTVLVALIDGSPAVVTEALWSLTMEKGERIDEVRIITTGKGKVAVEQTLLSPDGEQQDRRGALHVLSSPPRH